MLGALLSLALGAQVHVQPGTAHPGDAVLLTVTGAAGAPSGTLGTRELTFLPAGDGFQALEGLSVETPAGPLEFSVEIPLEDDAKEIIGGTLEVLPADFPRRELTVAKKFTNPSKKERAWAARDQQAFAEAFDVDFEPWLFAGDFQWPRVAEITAPFGDRRLLNGKQQSQHYGTDLDGDTGAPVAAANDGEIVLVRPCFGSGNTVLIHHGGRLFTAYFHLSKFETRLGATVKRGEPIGRVGKTGRVTGPHLHWGAKLDGRWINPASLLDLDFSR